jgi:hypothetical protein
MGMEWARAERQEPTTSDTTVNVLRTLTVVSGVPGFAGVRTRPGIDRVSELADSIGRQKRRPYRPVNVPAQAREAMCRPGIHSRQIEQKYLQ